MCLCWVWKWKCSIHIEPIKAHGVCVHWNFWKGFWPNAIDREQEQEGRFVLLEEDFRRHCIVFSLQKLSQYLLGYVYDVVNIGIMAHRGEVATSIKRIACRLLMA